MYSVSTASCYIVYCIHVWNEYDVRSVLTTGMSGEVPSPCTCACSKSFFILETSTYHLWPSHRLVRGVLWCLLQKKAYGNKNRSPRIHKLVCHRHHRTRTYKQLLRAFDAHSLKRRSVEFTQNKHNTHPSSVWFVWSAWSSCVLTCVFWVLGQRRIIYQIYDIDWSCASCHHALYNTSKMSGGQLVSTVLEGCIIIRE